MAIFQFPLSNNFKDARLLLPSEDKVHLTKQNPSVRFCRHLVYKLWRLSPLSVPREIRLVSFLLCFTAEELVQKKMEDLEVKAQLEQSVEGAYLTHLLLSDQMTVTEILGSITELLLAGVDTVSTDSAGGTQWGQCTVVEMMKQQFYWT